MATNPGTQASDAIQRRHIISGVRFILGLALLAAVVVCLVFLDYARCHDQPSISEAASQGTGYFIQNAPVEVRPWQTAEALAALAVTAEETEYARDAERLADHEVDQAFASALREAAGKPHPLTGTALTLSRKIEHLQQIVKEDQAAVQKPTPSPSPKTRRAAPPVADDLAIAKAQLGLDSDELADAQRDLAR